MFDLYLLLFKKQRKGIKKSGSYERIKLDEIKRLDKNIYENFFDSPDCVLYHGEVKNNYATISFKKKKVSVHRLIYHNYIGHIGNDDKIEFLCDMKGSCCNINHFRIKKQQPKKKKEEIVIV
jgi:hypothetical protein